MGSKLYQELESKFGVKMATVVYDALLENLVVETIREGFIPGGNIRLPKEMWKEAKYIAEQTALACSKVADATG